jgi:hypothetical protein
MYHYKYIKMNLLKSGTTTVMIGTIKIKESHNNSYEDTKKYGTYPTKDKKYVCQRGQSECFHVGSVEFCRLKIAQGTSWPQRSSDATGTTSATGPPMLTQLNALIHIEW